MEAILRYLDNADEIDNEGARKLLILGDNEISYVSRLFADMRGQDLIRELRRDNRKVWYEELNEELANEN